MPIEFHERIRSNFYGLVYAVTSDAGLKREEAIKAFRDLIAKHKRSVNYLLSRNAAFIVLLVHLLFESHCKADAELQNAILGIICVAAEHLPNKRIITAVREAIPILIVALREGLSMEIKTKCAIIFSLLSDDIPTNKVKIGELGGMGLLVGLLKGGDSEAKRAAALAISKLCEARENWGRAFVERAAIAALRAVYCNELVEEAMSILRALTGCHLILSEVMTEIVSLHESTDAEGSGNLGREIIYLVESELVRTSGESEVSCSPEIAEVLRWLKRRSHFPRTLGYKTNYI